jgi:hypothetical protein
VWVYKERISAPSSSHAELAPRNRHRGSPWILTCSLVLELRPSPEVQDVYSIKKGSQLV